MAKCLSKWKVAYVIEKRKEQRTGKIVFESRWIAMKKIADFSVFFFLDCKVGSQHK